VLHFEKIVNRVRQLAIYWLIFITAFIGGIYLYSAQRWPYPLVKQVEDYIRGDEGEQTTLFEKISNDLNLKPTRLIVDSDIQTTAGLEYGELTGLPLNPRRENPKIFLSDKAPAGYRAIIGVFDFDEHRFGVILIDPQGNVVNVWQVSQEDVSWEHPSDSNVFPHGFEIAPDGSIVLGFDEGTSLVKYDYCGKELWRLQGKHHHSIAFDGDDAIWVWHSSESKGREGKWFKKLNYETGAIIKEFRIPDVIKANLDIDIFGIRAKDTAKGSAWVWKGGGPHHPNDIEPLPKELEQQYPGFTAGDLLVSYRSVNLVFVMDQDTLEVKWWRQGLTRRQHDPDWNDRGTITIFNNNMHRKYSNIIEVDPLTLKSKMLLDGAKYNFYTWIQGKHQLLPNDGLLVTSPQQGRVFEVDGQGNITFDFLNIYGEGKAKHAYNGEKGMLLLSEARFLPVNFFGELPQCNQ
jgi:Arylsulfotransferase (ASST)